MDEALSVSGLCVKVQGRTLLDGVGFSAKKGETMAIVGPNGSGKTTLFRVLLGIVPYTGEVKWGSGKKIGYVPQSLISTDLPISVEEFLRFKCKAGLDRCIGYVGLHKDVLGQQLGSLSGGQLQRVLIAWAIVDNPDILLMDEPTSGVDIGSEEPIYQKVTQLKKSMGMTVLLISHNLHVVMHYSDHLLALNRRQTFYGPTSGLSSSRILGLMYGSTSGIKGLERHSRRPFR